MSRFSINPSLREFLSYVRPYRWQLFWATACGILKFNVPLVFPWALKEIIDEYLATPGVAHPGEIHWIMIGLLFMYVFWAVITYLRSYLSDRTGQRIIFDLRHELYTHLQRMWVGFYDKRRIGSIASRDLGDIAVAQNLVGAAVTNTVMDLSCIFLIAWILFAMNWKLALVAIAILPLYVALNWVFKTRIKRLGQLAQRQMEEIAGDVSEKLAGMAFVQSNTREKTEELRFVRESRRYFSHLLSVVKTNALAAATVGFLTSAAPVLVVWYGAVQVIGGELTVGELTAFFAYLGMFYGPLNRLTELNILVANSVSAIERVFEVFHTSPEIVDRPAARDVRSVRGEIEFRGVSFAYDASGPVLSDIDLHIAAGERVALVGHSGSGKSTLVKLLPRFYDVATGAITIDGIDIRDIRLKSLRRQIAMVPQEPILFSGTVEENIHYGRRQATVEEIRAAAVAADADEFIARMPAGYQSEIGEGGARLSGGERQRIALARAFLRNAPVLILDEATSALDSESESSIQQALESLMEGRTTLIIAHRLSTVQSADRIIVFERGRILESGAHADLLLRPGGLYRRLYSEQFRGSLV